MDGIKDFYRHSNDRFLSWSFCEKLVQKNFVYKVRPVELSDHLGVLVVEHTNDKGPDNAVIFNADGSERVRIKNPFPKVDAIGFADAYYVGGKLTLIAVTRPNDRVGCVIDTHGNVLRTYEIR